MNNTLQNDSTRINSLPAQEEFGHRYVFEKKIGSGGCGSVYCVRDRLLARVVALKTIESQSVTLLKNDELRMALAREFKAMAALSHPNVIGVLEYGFALNGNPFFTMELLESSSSILEATKGQSEHFKTDMMVQLLQALDYIHRRGLIHRDIKPGNVLEMNGRLRLLDFGLSITEGESASFGGTLWYLAPEILERKPPTIQTDLYSAGILFYEILVESRFPFQETTISGLYEAIQNYQLSEEHCRLVGKFGPILKSLIAKDPSKRFPDAASVIAAIGVASGEVYAIETESIREGLLQSLPLVGREAELELFNKAIADLKNGVGAGILVGGESGVGKSRLVEEVRIRSLVEGALVFRGQAICDGNGMYQLWSDILRALALRTTPTNQEAAVLNCIVPGFWKVYRKEIPEFRDTSPLSLQRAVLDSVSSLLSRVLIQPVILILEDLQWAEEESLFLLNHLLSLTPNLPLLIVGTYRIEEAPRLPDTLNHMRIVSLARLTLSEVDSLVRLVMGVRYSPELPLYLHRQTEGNVFFVVEVLRSLAEEVGELSRIANSSLPRSIMTTNLLRIIQRRLNRIPFRHRELLEAAAVFGRQIDLAVLKTLDMTEDIQEWVSGCAAVSVLEPFQGEYRFSHDKLREELLCEIRPRKLLNLHRCLAEAIEDHYDDSRIASLAYHWGAAGNKAKEGHYSLLAGIASARAYSNEQAKQYLIRALETLQDPVQVTSAKLSLGKVYSITGDLERARSIFTELLSHSRDDLQIQAECEIALGQILFSEGTYEEAMSLFHKAENHSLQSGNTTLLIQSLASTGVLFLEQGLYSKALQYFIRCQQLSESEHDKWGQAQAFLNQASIYFRKADYGECLIQLKRALAFEDLIDERQLMKVKGNVGAVTALLGDYAQALPYLQETVLFAKRAGDPLLYLNNLGNLGNLYRFAGNYSQAMLCHHAQLDRAVQLGNLQSVGIALDDIGETLAAEGKFQESKPVLELATRVISLLNDPMHLCTYLSDLAFTAVSLGEFESAMDLADRAKHIAQELGDKEVLFYASMTLIQAKHGAGQMGQHDAATELRGLLDDSLLPEWQARLYHQLAQYEPNPQTLIESAAQIYAELHEKEPKAEFREAYLELTGIDVGIPPGLPEVAKETIMGQRCKELHSLLEDVERLVEQRMSTM